MFGKNPKLPFEKESGNHLKVHSIFLTTQGEGPYAGCKAVFIRLSGCNLACTFCDTEFDNFATLSIAEILRKVISISSDTNLIIITGGEPFRQDIRLLCEKLLLNNFKIQIETNGTLYVDIPKAVELVCSPKISNSRYHQIRKDILKQTIAIKFLISAQNKYYSDISEIGQSKYDIPVYVQPIDEYNEMLNKNNLILAQQIARRYKGTISLQFHKIFGID